MCVCVCLVVCVVCVSVCVCGGGGKRLMFIVPYINKRYIPYIITSCCTIFIYYLFFRHVSSLILSYLQEAYDFFPICAFYTKSTGYLLIAEN